MKGRSRSEMALRQRSPINAACKNALAGKNPIGPEKKSYRGSLSGRGKTRRKIALIKAPRIPAIMNMERTNLAPLLTLFSPTLSANFITYFNYTPTISSYQVKRKKINRRAQINKGLDNEFVSTKIHSEPKMRNEEKGWMIFFGAVLVITIAFYAGSVYCRVVYSQTYTPSFKEMEEKLFWCGLATPFIAALIGALYASTPRSSSPSL